MLGTSELSISNDISYLPAVQAFAGEVARECGFAEEDGERILLALEEAVTNVIEHAFEHGEKATFKIIFEPTSTCLTIIVKDKGLPFAPDGALREGDLLPYLFSKDRLCLWLQGLCNCSRHHPGRQGL